MKTKKKVLILRTLKHLLALSFSTVMLFAIAKPMSWGNSENINDEHDRSKYRPILDSTIVCSRRETWWGYEIDFFYIVEHMPRPKFPIYEIENILEKDIRFNAQELSYNDTIYFQCVVNCMGIAGDYQILKCPVELVNIGCQVLNVLRNKFAEWEPPIQQGQNVDLLTIIKVKVNKGQFEVIYRD